MDRSKTNEQTSPFRVLVLEPDPKAAKALKRELARGDLRFEVVHCTDAQSALTEASSDEASYHAVVVSNVLPETSGLEFYHRLRSANVTVPTVLLFESGEEDDASTALVAGVEDVLLRDDNYGYLKLLPGLLARLSRPPGGSATGSPERLAVVVRSDPESTEYKTAAHSLRDSEPLLRALVEIPFQYFMLVDTDTTIQYINKMAPGVRFEDVIGKQTMYDFAPPEDRDRQRGHFEELFRTGGTIHFDTFIPMLEQWYSITAGPVFDGGKIVGASIFARDITEQKLVENQLKESERRFRRLAESIRDVFYILDIEERRTVYVSPAYEEIYGRSLESIYENALSWMEAVHPDDLERVQLDFEKMASARADYHSGLEFRIVKPDGEIRWIKNRAFIIQDPHGEPTQVAGVAADVTLAKEAQERLRRSEKKYRTLVDQASDGIFVANMEGMHVDVNDAGCKMLGYTREEVLAISIRDLIPAEDLAAGPPRPDWLKDGKLVMQERRLKRKDGSILPVEASVKILPGGLVQAIVRDITKRKEAEENLRRAHDDLERRVEERTNELRDTIEAFEKAQRLASIGTLAAGIAHEINNPIGSILMAADTALYSLDEAKHKDDAVEAIASIKNDARRVGQIVKTVLQLSRQEASQKWACDPGDIARRARDITRRLAVQKNVHVDLEIDSGLPQVVINPTEIEQVFVNVISNAIEASRPDQSVSVRLLKEGHNVVAFVTDQGRGMTREEISRIFDPFYTTRQSEGGTGLGLSLTYSILRQHNGTIDVESQPGEGTRVAISLPVGATPTSDEESG